MESRRNARCIDMTTHFDVSADLLIPALADAMEGIDAISTPDWADYVKTGVTRERPPTQANWWFIRSAALLRKVARMVRLASQHYLRCTVEERITVPCLTHPQLVQDTSSEHHFTTSRCRISRTSSIKRS